ncbi:ribosome silencing factor [Myxococcota bacterium]|nr:ribosome silencing factor [Myxococcota bacterium]MBU1537685.1 ribosome silencing factor [Myxococcota bacterium]
MVESVHLVKGAIDALLDRNCQDAAVYKVGSFVGYTDYIVVATGRSSRQIKSLADEVESRVRSLGGKIIGVEGREAGDWVLVDCGGVVIHLFQESSRDYYKIDELWSSYKVAPEALK